MSNTLSSDAGPCPNEGHQPTRQKKKSAERWTHRILSLHLLQITTPQLQSLPLKVHKVWGGILSDVTDQILYGYLATVTLFTWLGIPGQQVNGARLHHWLLRTQQVQAHAAS